MPGVFKTLIWLFAANPDLGLIWISKFFGIATANPVGIISDLPGRISICLSILAAKSRPDEPSVSYLGKLRFLITF